MRKVWLALFFAAFSCAKKTESRTRTDRSIPTDDRGQVEELALEEPGEGISAEPIETDDPLFFRVEEVEELAARMRAEGVSDREAQMRACIAEEDLLPKPDAAVPTGEEASRLSELVKLLRKGGEGLEAILAIEKSAKGLSREELPGDLVPTLLGHAGLFHLYDGRVRLSAARILRRLADARSVPFLRRARALHGDDEFRREVERALEACSSGGAR